MINKKNIKQYIKDLFGVNSEHVRIKKIGEGVQGAGFLIEARTPEGVSSYVIKGLYSEGLEHDYPSDRAGVFLLDLDEFGNLPKHVKAVDVLAEMKDGSIKSIGGGREYYLLMEKAEGRHYFHDLSALAVKKRLDDADIAKIKALTSYLANIHSVRKVSRHLYWRKVRDTIGHGECLMGVFDTYPDGAMSYEEMADIEKKCVDWRMRLKRKGKRLCQIHGDFHPGNIWFKHKEKERKAQIPDADNLGSEARKYGSTEVKDFPASALPHLETDFILLDRSRGPWGEAADDVTALTVNYIFFSIRHFGKLHGPYLEALKLFYDHYIKKTGDAEVLEVAAPFYAFRGAVVANPVFYPEVTKEERRKILNFVHGVLDDESFKVDRVNGYIKRAKKR